MLTVSESVKILNKKYPQLPKLAIILGSGWNHILHLPKLKILFEISYQDLFGVATTVKGHDGKLIVAELQKQKVILLAGRFHRYEGYSAEEATRPIQVLAQCGLKRVVITAAAGALNEKYRVGDFIILSDLITIFGISPLTGTEFVDLSQIFNLELREKAKKICAQAQIPFSEGIYVYVRGPHFETPADKMALHHLGADVVGMSTMPETIMARRFGIDVLGLAYVTNLAFVKHDHKDVLAAAEKGGQQMVQLLTGLIC